MTIRLRRPLAAFAVAGPCFWLPAVAAETPAGEESAPLACAEAMDRSTVLNGRTLIAAAASCFRDARHVEGNFLLVAGQVRSMTDMSLLTPAGDADEIAAAELYGLIFFQAGGTGYDEVYRDPLLRQQLFDGLDAWSPALFDGYDPGWRYRSGPAASLYDEMAAYMKATRLAQVRHYAELIQDDAYYAARREFGELQARNPGGLVAGSPDADRADALMSIMREISAAVPKQTVDLKPPDIPPPEPDPDAGFEQLWVGFDGPESTGVAVFENEAGVLSSWLPDAIGGVELADILARVDFETQILVALAIGERETATGAVHMNVSYNAIHESLTVSARVGVNEEGCDFPYSKSYPFALAVVARPPLVPDHPGYGLSNFGDGCKPPISGRPSGSR